ncbi:unnamed protein product [Camellia sinensis]
MPKDCNKSDSSIIGSSSSNQSSASIRVLLDMAFGNGNPMEIDENLHSRQLAAYGRETMRRLFASNVLVSRMQGLGVKIEIDLGKRANREVTSGVPIAKRSMSTRGRGRAGYAPRPHAPTHHAPTPHASTKSTRSSTQSTPRPNASIKSVRSSTPHPFTSESTDVGTSKGKRGRGKSRSLKLAKLKNQGVRLPIQICKVSGRPYGEASEKFTSELGIVIRQFAPQNGPSWIDISKEDKETLIAYLP